jgi:hypothetical protein
MARAFRIADFALEQPRYKDPEKTPIAVTTEQCPGCNEMLSYVKNDYFFE